MDNLILQKAGKNDIDILLHMNQRLIEDEQFDRPLEPVALRKRWQNFLKKDYITFLFLEGQELVGYALVSTSDSPLYIRHFFIERDYRQRGLGKRAFHRLIDKLDVDRIDLEVMVWNDDAIRFYESIGLKQRYIGMTYNRK